MLRAADTLPYLRALLLAPVLLILFIFIIYYYPFVFCMIMTNGVFRKLLL